MKSRVLSLIVSLTILIQLSACLQGAATTAVALVNGGGVHGTGISLGPIAAFGSVYVNGTRYDTDNAVFLINGQTAAQDDLDIGQIIRVEADENDDASSVEYVETVKGPIQSINLASSTLVALGQTVQITTTTTFDNTSLATLLVGDIVEVSGLRDENQVIQASYVEKEDNVQSYQVTGIIADLNATTFKIADLIVMHNDPALSEGMLVDVVGLAADFDGTTFIAAEIRPGFGLDHDDGEEIEVEGYITSFTSASLFEVNGVVIQTNANTQVENGVLSDLALGVRIEVEGTGAAGGAILAEKIEIEPESELELRTFAEAVDVVNNSITLFGITIGVNSSTSFKDESDLEVQSFGLADINVGDYIEIKAFDQGQGITATKVERKNPEDDLKLEGPVAAIDVVLFTLDVLGVSILTDQFTEYKDANEVNINQAQFFALIAVDSFVEVKWDANLGVTSPAKEIELEGIDD